MSRADLELEARGEMVQAEEALKAAALDTDDEKTVAAAKRFRQAVHAWLKAKGAI